MVGWGQENTAVITRKVGTQMRRDGYGGAGAGRSQLPLPLSRCRFLLWFFTPALAPRYFRLGQILVRGPQRVCPDTGPGREFPGLWEGKPQCFGGARLSLFLRLRQCSLLIIY